MKISANESEISVGAYLKWYRQPILYAFLALLCLITLISYIALRELNSLQKDLLQTTEVPLKKIRLLDSMVHHSRQRQVLLRDIAISQDAFDQDEFIQEHSRQAFLYLQARNELEAMADPGREQELMHQIIGANVDAYDIQLEVVQLSQSEDIDNALRLIRDELGPNREVIYPIMLEFRDLLIEESSRAIRSDQENAAEARRRIIVLYLSAMLVGSVLVILAYRVQRRHYKATVWRATHDDLTGLYNRFQFGRLLSGVNSSQQMDRYWTLIYADLDQFKLINDTAGHIAGDELLRQVVEKLSAYVAGRGDLCRIGGDEFAILLPDCDKAGAERFANNILGMFASCRFAWTDHLFDITASMGVVVFRPRETSDHDLMAAADIACQTAKETGRSRFHVYNRQDEETTTRVEEMRWAARLRSAISAGEIQLFYQPIVNTKDIQALHRLEILLRIADEDGQMLNAAKVIAAAEKFDMASTLDEYMVRRVVEFAQKHPDKEMVYNINLSGQSLASKQTLYRIVELIDKSKIEPSRFCFEITETAAITRFTNAKTFMSVLRGMGCTFALDDFGSGVSSFGYLNTLPVDMIKIDSTFIQNLHTDKTSRAIVLAIREVAGVFGTKLVAEGVENELIKEKLEELGIEYFQGYVIARPAPVTSLLH